MTQETLSEMLARHAQEVAALVARMTEDAHQDGMRDRLRAKSAMPRHSELVAIADAVAAEAHTSAALIVSHQHKHDKALIHGRRKCWFLAQQAGFSLNEIGSFFNRDHTSILNGIRKFQQHARRNAA